MYHSNPQLSSILELVLAFLRLAKGNNDDDNNTNKKNEADQFWNKIGMNSRRNSPSSSSSSSSFASCFTSASSSFSNNIESAFSIIKVIETLISNHHHHHLNNNSRSSSAPIITQRDIYYSFVELLPRRDQNVVNKAIQHLCSFSNSPRYQLGIFTSTKGFIAGSLILGDDRIFDNNDDDTTKNTSSNFFNNDDDDDEIATRREDQNKNKKNPTSSSIDLSRLGGCQGMAIPGEFAALPEWKEDETKLNYNHNPSSQTKVPPIAFTSSARCILVVEKDSVFQRLVQDRIWTKFPMIIVTGRGFPDVATKTIVSRLALWMDFKIPVYGLVDYNPSGIRILFNYRFGNLKQQQQQDSSSKSSSVPLCPSIRWLGARAQDLSLVQAGELFMTRATKNDEDGETSCCYSDDDNDEDANNNNDDNNRNFFDSSLLNQQTEDHQLTNDNDDADDESSNHRQTIIINSDQIVSSSSTSTTRQVATYVPTTRLSARDLSIAKSLKRDINIQKKKLLLVQSSSSSSATGVIINNNNNHHHNNINKAECISSLDEWLDEVDQMLLKSVKFDLEAIPDLCSFVIRKVVGKDAV